MQSVPDLKQPPHTHIPPFHYWVVTDSWLLLVVFFRVIPDFYFHSLKNGKKQRYWLNFPHSLRRVSKSIPKEAGSWNGGGVFLISGTVGVWKSLAVRRTWAKKKTQKNLLSLRMELARLLEGGVWHTGCDRQRLGSRALTRDAAR